MDKLSGWLANYFLYQAREALHTNSIVVPAKAVIQKYVAIPMDSGLRRNIKKLVADNLFMPDIASSDKTSIRSSYLGQTQGTA